MVSSIATPVCSSGKDFFFSSLCPAPSFLGPSGEIERGRRRFPFGLLCVGVAGGGGGGGGWGKQSQEEKWEGPTDAVAF